MPATPAHLLGHIRRLAARPADDPTTDAALLDRWVHRRDEDAFAALVARHGPVVLRVCRRVLADSHAAEDALQATFLVLARRAASVRPRGAVAAWLFGVARRVALKARTAEARRRARLAGAAGNSPPRPPEDPLDRLSARELLALLDEEVARLPERYRLPVVVCCLEGRSVEEAARLLGWTDGSVKGRLERGRRRLRERLARRGVDLAAVLLAGGLAAEGTAAGLPAAFVAATARAAAAFAAGQATADAAVPAALARDVLRGSAASPLRAVAGLLAALGVAAGASALAPNGSQPADALRARAAAPEAPKADLAAATRTDRFGDPLPASALARFGTARLRHGGIYATAVAFSRDGKVLSAAAADGFVSSWDAATGRPLRRIRVAAGDQAVIALSPDGEVIAAVGADGSPVLWSAATGRELRRLGRPGDPTTRCLAFTPNGRVLATSGDDHVVRLWEVATGRAVGELRGGPRVPVQFSPDGKLLAAVNRNGDTCLYDVQSEQELRRLKGPTTITPNVAFSPNGRTLAVALDTAVELQDVATGRPSRRFEGQEQYAITVAFAPDGRLLLTTDVAGILRTRDVATGAEVCRAELGEGGVRALALSPDGKAVAFATSGPAIRLRDVATGRALVPPGGHEQEVMAVAFSPNGSVLATAALGMGESVRLWDSDKCQPLAACEGPWISRLVFPRDGRSVFAGRGGPTIRMRDAGTGRELRCFVAGEADATDRTRVEEFALLPGGKALRAVCRTNPPVLPRGGMPTGTGVTSAYEWDLATNERRRLWEQPAERPLVEYLSPDGSCFAVAEGSRVKVLDATTARVHRTLNGRCDVVRVVAFSPDSRLVAGVCCHGARYTAAVWELATGKEVRRFEAPGWVPSVAFSPDGRMLAAGGTDATPTVLWDVATGQELQRLQGHGCVVGVLAFAPERRRLATGHRDSTTLVWDVSPALRRSTAAPGDRSAAGLERAWNALAGEDAAAAQAALATLTAAPQQATAFIRSRLRAAPPPDAKVTRLLADLDSDSFQAREDATRELERLGPQAEPAVRRSLQNRPSPELRRRAEELLAKLEGPLTDPEALRQLRAVAALEHLGAADVLRELSAGAPEARLTREAKASLARLEDRRAAAP